MKPPVSWHHWVCSQPEMAKLRNDIARTYREIRKDNPAMARLVYARMKEAQAKTLARMTRLFDGDGSLRPTTLQ